MRTFVHVDERLLWDDLRVLIGGGGNTTALLHGDQALVVDPKLLGFAQQVRFEVERNWRRRVTRVLLTHSHGDHTAGTVEFDGVGAVLAHPRTRERMLKGRPPCGRGGRRSRADERSAFDRSEPAIFEPGRAGGVVPECALPFVDIERDMQLWLGGEEVHVRSVPYRAHTDGDLIAWLPERKLVIAGDLVLNGWLPHCTPSEGGDMLGMARALDELLALPFEKVIPGHGEIADRAVVEEQRAYLRALEADVRDLRERGLGEDAAAANVALRPEFAHLRVIPGDSHAKNVRFMYQAIVERERQGEAALTGGGARLR